MIGHIPFSFWVSDFDVVLAPCVFGLTPPVRFSTTSGKLPPLVRLNALLRATDAIHSETETADDLRFLLGAGSPLGGARPKSAVSLAEERLAIAKFPKPDDTRDIAAGEILALTLAGQAGSYALRS